MAQVTTLNAEVSKLTTRVNPWKEIALHQVAPQRTFRLPLEINRFVTSNLGRGGYHYVSTVCASPTTSSSRIMTSWTLTGDSEEFVSVKPTCEPWRYPSWKTSTLDFRAQLLIFILSSSARSMYRTIKVTLPMCSVTKFLSPAFVRRPPPQLSPSQKALFLFPSAGRRSMSLDHLVITRSSTS